MPVWTPVAPVLTLSVVPAARLTVPEWLKLLRLLSATVSDWMSKLPLLFRFRTLLKLVVPAPPFLVRVPVLVKVLTVPPPYCIVVLPCTVRLPLLVNWAPLTIEIGPLPVHSALVLAVLKLRVSSVFVPVPKMFSVAPLAISVAPLPFWVPLVQLKAPPTVTVPAPPRVPPLRLKAFKAALPPLETWSKPVRLVVPDTANDPPVMSSELLELIVKPAMV